VCHVVPLACDLGQGIRPLEQVRNLGEYKFTLRAMCELSLIT